MRLIKVLKCSIILFAFLSLVGIDVNATSIGDFNECILEETTLSIDNEKREDVSTQSMPIESIDVSKLERIDSVEYSDFGNWRSGVYAYGTGEYHRAGSRICLNDYVTVNSKQEYIITVSDEVYHVLIREFDQSGKYLKSTDFISGGIFIPDERTMYAAISIYRVDENANYNSYRLMFENGFTISINSVKDNKAKYDNLSYINLSDFNNWRSGHYNFQEGKYNEYDSRICLNDYVIVDKGNTYDIKISDKAYHVLIRELNDQDKLIQSYNLADGDTYTVKENTAYVGISIYPVNYTATYSTYKKLFDKGFTVKISKQGNKTEENKEDTSRDEEYVSLETIDLNDFNNWRSGVYTFSTGKYSVSPARICLNNYVSVDVLKSYNIYISDENYHVLIREIDSAGNYIKSNELISGDIYSPQQNTSYIGISLYKVGDSVNYDSFKELFKNGFQIGIDAWGSDDKNYEPSDIVLATLTSADSVITVDYTNFANWRSGHFNLQTGTYDEYSTRLCLIDYISIEPDKTYIYTVSDTIYHVLVRIMNSEGKLIQSINLISGNEFTTPSSAAKVGISIYRTDEAASYEKYKDMFANGFNIGIEECATPTVEKIIPTSAYEELYRMLLEGDSSTVDFSKYNVTYNQLVNVIWPQVIADHYLEYRCYFYPSPVVTYNSRKVTSCSLKNIDSQGPSRIAKSRKKLEKYLASVDPKMNDLEKLLLAHDFVIENMYYKTGDLPEHCAGGVLGNGHGACDGISMAVEVCLRYVGVASYIVVSDNMNHAWLMVNIDNDWYHVDPTWDYNYITNRGYGKHRFLMRNDEEFLSGLDKNHYDWTVRGASNLTSKSNKFTNWFVHDVSENILYFNGYWYYADTNAKTIVKSTIYGNDSTIVIQSNGSKTKVVSIDSGVLTYYQGSELKKMKLQ